MKEGKKAYELKAVSGARALGDAIKYTEEVPCS